MKNINKMLKELKSLIAKHGVAVVVLMAIIYFIGGENESDE